MNRNIILGGWQQFTGRAMQVWGRVTHDPFSMMAGRRKEHIGNMQEMYGRFESNLKQNVTRQIVMPHFSFGWDLIRRCSARLTTTRWA